jgi:putative FmdB family regulatory protein
MPIYEYQCRECGSHIEKRQSISEEPLKICESCGGQLEKKISLSGFQFKGAGWYVTDYSRSNGKKTESSDGPAEKSSAGESTGAAADASKPKSDPPAASKPDASTAKD